MGDAGKPRPYNVSVFWFWAIEIPVRNPPPQSASAPTQPPGSRLPTLRLPTCFGVPTKLIRLPNALGRAGRPRSSPRAASRLVGYADA
ncbi:MAG: hypothetical protein LBQ66_05090 [Planctomycetaceae bacterium]|nr:hypothetical protein [Planctomycetaceae bacterium]